MAHEVQAVGNIREMLGDNNDAYKSIMRQYGIPQPESRFYRRSVDTSLDSVLGGTGTWAEVLTRTQARIRTGNAGFVGKRATRPADAFTYLIDAVARGKLADSDVKNAKKAPKSYGIALELAAASGHKPEGYEAIARQLLGNQYERRLLQ